MTQDLKIALGLAGVLSLLGCQSTDTRAIQKWQKVQPAQHAQVFCLGATNCEFERVDQTLIVDAATGRVNPAAIEQGLLRLRDKRLSDPHALYLSLPQGPHELVMRFYPISPDRAETFHVFHRFQAGQAYQFVMYRKRVKQQRNLLDASIPEPLCVDIQQNRQTIRRFCKPFNAATGIGEFVEQKI